MRSKTPSPTPSPSSFPPRFLGGLFWRFPPALWFCQRIGVSRTRRWGRPQPPRNDVVGRARTHLDHAQCSGKVCPHIPRVPGTRVIVRPSGTASGRKHQSATAQSQSQHSHSTQSQHSPSHAIGHSIGLQAPISGRPAWTPEKKCMSRGVRECYELKDARKWSKPMKTA